MGANSSVNGENREAEQEIHLTYKFYYVLLPLQNWMWISTHQTLTGTLFCKPQRLARSPPRFIYADILVLRFSPPYTLGFRERSQTARQGKMHGRAGGHVSTERSRTFLLACSMPAQVSGAGGQH